MIGPKARLPFHEEHEAALRASGADPAEAIVGHAQSRVLGLANRPLFQPLFDLFGVHGLAASGWKGDEDGVAQGTVLLAGILVIH